VLKLFISDREELIPGKKCGWNWLGCRRDRLYPRSQRSPIRRAALALLHRNRRRRHVSISNQRQRRPDDARIALPRQRERILRMQSRARLRRPLPLLQLYAGLFRRNRGGRGSSRPGSIFAARRLPPLRALSPLTMQAISGLTSPRPQSWGEMGLQLAARAIQLAAPDSRCSKSAPAGAVARVTRILRRVESQPAAELSLASMARDARLSPWHFLRTFEGITGITPHQYVLRTRLRLAATRLAADSDRVIDIALDCGFGDLSTFNRAFRAEFGVTPRSYRARH